MNGPQRARNKGGVKEACRKSGREIELQASRKSGREIELQARAKPSKKSRHNGEKTIKNTNTTCSSNPKYFV